MDVGNFRLDPTPGASSQAPPSGDTLRMPHSTTPRLSSNAKYGLPSDLCTTVVAITSGREVTFRCWHTTLMVSALDRPSRRSHSMPGDCMLRSLTSIRSGSTPLVVRVMSTRTMRAFAAERAWMMDQDATSIHCTSSKAMTMGCLSLHRRKMRTRRSHSACVRFMLVSLLVALVSPHSSPRRDCIRGRRSEMTSLAATNLSFTAPFTAPVGSLFRLALLRTVGLSGPEKDPDNKSVESRDILAPAPSEEDIREDILVGEALAKLTSAIAVSREAVALTWPSIEVLRDDS
mmetsp:Transcript_47152/g.75494  ORF Transcript_47152/g.75494 Transcript_47152/m.75494 type:complete len:289 (+) Transcript_47152:2-868(+)